MRTIDDIIDDIVSCADGGKADARAFAKELADTVRVDEACRYLNRWQPIETAPKDGTKVDLWAKCWRSWSDDFIFDRFPSCYWTRGDSMTNRQAHWVNLDSSWHATHWMPLPEPPK